MRALSLRAKVFFLFAGAALLIVVPALLLIADAVEGRVYERATRDLAQADSSLQSNWELRGENLVRTAQLRAFDPQVAEAWRTRRFRLLARRLAEGKDVVLAADTTYGVLLGPPIDSVALRRAEGPGTSLVLTDSGPPLRLALSGVVVDDTIPLGLVGVGARLSAAGLKKEISPGAEVALIAGDSLIGTTLPDSVLAQMADDIDLRRVGAVQEAPQRLRVGGRLAYLARAYPLPARGVPARVVLLRPITDELRVAEGITQSIFGIGFTALVLALLLAALVARIVARPAQVLAEASARLARGDYRAPLPRDAGDEIGQLARAFGEMRRAIAEREERLRSAQAEMIHREKLAAMGRLVAQLSHEINNPIYNIQNCLEALERRGDPTDPNREFLTLAQEELSRMATLTRQLLDQSRPLPDAAQAVGLNTVVQRVLTLARPEVEARGIRVETSLAPRLPDVVAHPEGIQQVLANLVSNACDAMPAGGRLRVTTRADGDAVEVVVEDTGSGIAEADLPHIFEAFYTTKPGVAGIGLGLFVSEGIVRGHRGRLSVESRVGEGSRFTVRLPRETLDESLAVTDDAPAMAGRAAMA
ncbi:MAG TPA: ATP-binding protein [Longimicrobium sp.]|nr:ATP-binding protein [Longimicrobium sp.]